MSDIFDSYYAGPERRVAASPRRLKSCRRHRTRTESLVSECRAASSRRNGEEDGFIEALNLTESVKPSTSQPHIAK